MAPQRWETDVRRPAWRLAAPAILLAVALLALPSSVALAAEAPDDEGEPAEVTREGYYTNDLSEGLPPAVMREFPHAVVCIVVPESCGEDLQPLHETVHGGILAGADAVDAAPQPAQPVAPGTLPVGMLGGEERYTSALRFELPPVPEGQMITRLELVLHAAQSSFSMESPAFRRLLRTMIAQYTEGPSQEPFADAVERIATQEEPLLSTEITGVEACAVTEPWGEGENQPGEEMPERDCILGDTGLEAEDGSYVFDLTFTAEAWREGDLPNEGILLAPLGAPNLEFGDPDYSTNFVIAFAGSEADDGERPKIRVTFDDEITTDFELDGTPAFEATDPAPPPSNGFGVGTTPPNVDDFDAPEADMPQLEADEPLAAPDVAEEELAADELPVFPTPAALWLLLPLMLSGGWWYARVLDVQPAAASARSGALSRIAELRGQR